MSSNVPIRLPSSVIDVNEKKIPKRIRMIKPASDSSSANQTAGCVAARDNTYTPCRNPLDKLCHLLLPYKLFEIKNSGVVEAPLDKVIPTRFKSIGEYVLTWEPLLMMEIKEHIASNVSFLVRENCSTGTITLIQSPDAIDVGKVVKLSYVLQEKDPSTARDR